MMALAQELGVDELRIACEDHVTSTLSVASACTFLMAAMDIQERSPGMWLSYFTYSFTADFPSNELNINIVIK